LGEGLQLDPIFARDFLDDPAVLTTSRLLEGLGRIIARVCTILPFAHFIPDSH
jgi:hypothetical protein